MIHRRAARYVSNRFGNRSSVDNMLQQMNWRSLEQRRQDARLTMLYKIVNDKVCIETSARLIPPSRRTRHTQPHAFQITSCSADYQKFSFFPRTIREWNSLPPEIVTPETSSSESLFTIVYLLKVSFSKLKNHFCRSSRKRL